MSADALENNLKDMDRMVSTALTELEATGAPCNEHDVFKTKLEGWIDGAKEKQKKCQAVFEKYKTNLAEALTFFCEDRRCTAEDFFGLFERFRQLYSKAVEENETLRKLDAKRAAIAKQKADKIQKNQAIASGASEKQQIKAQDKAAVGNLIDSIAAPKRGKGKGRGRGR